MRNQLQTVLDQGAGQGNDETAHLKKLYFRGYQWGYNYSMVINRCSYTRLSVDNG